MAIAPTKSRLEVWECLSSINFNGETLPVSSNPPVFMGYLDRELTELTFPAPLPQIQQTVAKPGVMLDVATVGYIWDGVYYGLWDDGTAQADAATRAFDRVNEKLSRGNNLLAKAIQRSAQPRRVQIKVEKVEVIDVWFTAKAMAAVALFLMTFFFLIAIVT